ncbi:MAG TPA: hypothetical protein VGN42_11745 [Pirellulales bacterium]|nr:hypothetical protein [Pirellulales bacterium]
MIARKLGYLQWLGVLVCACAGCGKAPARAPIQEVPVKGLVTLDGKPLAGAEVIFTSPSLAVFTGATKDDGSFQLSSSFGGETVCKGLCKVTIGKWVMPAGVTPQPNMSPQLQGAKQLLPPRYSDPAQTKLSKDVPEAGGDFKFELTSQ